ncbi:MAG: 23S rRNA (uracil(1939)-C(5))-methyltransferase RlmD [Bacteroidales bacterium]|nr:23S rRNA (uracil(1939)-C(5))-methyltransferase RlmD [Bacteroidales bacterium]
MSRKKEQPIIENVPITDIGAEGKAIAHIEGMVVFVPFVVPGDVADIKILKKKKRYAEGRAVAMRHYSERRAEPQCPHFGTCGGCRWQNLNYADQLAAKQQQVRDNLERLGRIDCQGMQPICGSDDIFFYRNKLEFTFSTKAWHELPPQKGADGEVGPATDGQPDGALGFHIPTLFDKVLNIEHCALQPDLSNQIRLAVRDYAMAHQLPYYDIRNHTGCLRNLIIRNSSTGEWMVVVVIAEYHDGWEGLLEHLRERFPQIASLQYIFNDKMNDSYADLPSVTFAGSDHITEQMEGFNGAAPLRFTIRPQTFYQTNSRQAQRLYSFVAQFAELTANDLVYDLYTGTGTIALFLAHLCRHVVGIEYVEDSIIAARENARQNQIGNTDFYAGDMAQVLTADFVAAHGRPDVVVTDPPRAGMHEKVVEQLLAMEPRKIVYVSCNPATQARDLALLSAKYRVARIQPVDMFPHTQHVENIAELILF